MLIDQRWAAIAAEVRASVVNLLKEDEALLLVSPPESVSSRDGFYGPYQPNKDLFRLTGITQAETVLYLDKKRAWVFVPPVDATREHWNGRMVHPTDIESLGMTPKNLEHLMPDLLPVLKTQRRLYCQLGLWPSTDKMILRIQGSLESPRERGYNHGLDFCAADRLLSPLRYSQKTQGEIELIRQACSIAAKTYAEAWDSIGTFKSEREIQGFFYARYHAHGATLEGYNGIFASGPNSTCLHYTQNSDPLKDFVLIDSGCTVQGYHSDISRTYPTNGKPFTGIKRDVYQLVTRTKDECTQLCAPGVSWAVVYQHAIRTMTEGLVQLKVIPNSLQEALEKNLVRQYFTHGLGHPLGLDVHDVVDWSTVKVVTEPDQSKPNGLRSITTFTLAPGAVMTIEPGLYFYQPDAPQELKGFGVRMEDNILITPQGFENLTKAAPCP